MDSPKYPNPHEIEGHSQAHRDAFDDLIKRIGKAIGKQPQPEPKRTPFGGRTHRAHPRIRWGR